MSRVRLLVLLGGFFGLLVCALLAAIAAQLIAHDIISPPLPFRAVTALLSFMLAGFSLAEIPLMVYAMRRLLFERQVNLVIVLALNALYVSFAAVYGVPLLLLTGDVGWGLALCSLGILRLISSVIFVHEPPP